MEYVLGNSYKIKSIGQTEKITCPCCNNKVNFSVFSNLNSRLTASIKLLDIENIYFLICPSCASVYGVDSCIGKEFKKGEKLSIGNFDLKPLKEYKVD